MRKLHEAAIQKVIAACWISPAAIASTLGAIFPSVRMSDGGIGVEELPPFVFFFFSFNVFLVFVPFGHEKHHWYHPHKQQDREYNIIHSHPPNQVPLPRPVQDTHQTISKVTSTLIIRRCSVLGHPSCWLAPQPVKIDPLQAAWRRRNGCVHPRPGNIQDACPAT
ncbi:MAG: hypothetical protein JJ869_17605 [Marivita sp.]|uniref:hypothetical protein n=1 Tax=Marivita sp. TaxID=2003365 RepID=UPI001B0C449C|nr:hypothetical protein [Marivita sp.]MBO6885373.1 hypothetical protein [Marivita sp.]